MLFSEMGLSTEIQNAIAEMGFVSPTPIQEEVIPVLNERTRDVIGLAQTGTGKTAAFGLPALSKINVKANYPQLLILSPTRELCMQITRDLESFSKYMKGLSIVAVYGGAPIDKQIRKLKDGVHVIVATPGRLRDLIKRKRVQLSKIEILVLDEADEMLKMGFREEIDEILEQAPKERTTLLFSATMGPDIAKIARNYMVKPLEITVGTKNASAENVQHIYHAVHAKDRYMALKRVVDFYPDVYGIVFCRTRKETKDVAASLMKEGYNAEALHGDLTQSQRDYVMGKFREKTLRLLVATDVAARGLDVSDLTHVINYNLPDEIESYNHRSGRTGRAGKQGLAISIINMKEKGKIRQIEKNIKKSFEYRQVPSGQEICGRQLINMIDKVKNSEVKHDRIDPYMPQVYEMLESLDKEELIKRFVSVEFNRFLNYYKVDVDINADLQKPDGFDQNKNKRGKRGMSRVIFNLGKGKGLSKKDVIELMVKSSGRKDVEIGQIDIYKRVTSVEVDNRMKSVVLKSLNNMSFRGVSLEAEENYEFVGNDFRDRDKGPRGKKRRR